MRYDGEPRGELSVGCGATRDRPTNFSSELQALNDSHSPGGGTREPAAIQTQPTPDLCAELKVILMVLIA